MPVGQKHFEAELSVRMEGNCGDPRRSRAGSCVEFYQVKVSAAACFLPLGNTLDCSSSVSLTGGFLEIEREILYSGDKRVIYSDRHLLIQNCSVGSLVVDCLFWNLKYDSQ